MVNCCRRQASICGLRFSVRVPSTWTACDAHHLSPLTPVYTTSPFQVLSFSCSLALVHVHVLVLSLSLSLAHSLSLTRLPSRSSLSHGRSLSISVVSVSLSPYLSSVPSFPFLFSPPPPPDHATGTFGQTCACSPSRPAGGASSSLRPTPCSTSTRTWTCTRPGPWWTRPACCRWWLASATLTSWSGRDWTTIAATAAPAASRRAR